MFFLTILTAFFQTLQTQTFQSDLTFTIADQSTQPLNYTGKLIMCGEQFELDMLGYRMAYDGATLYMYQEETNELTLSNPSREELCESNPFLLAQEVAKLSEVKENVTNSGIVTVTLLPQQSVYGVERIELRVHRDHNVPLSISVWEGTKQSKLTFHKSNLSTEKHSFVLDVPGAIINDLR